MKVGPRPLADQAEERERLEARRRGGATRVQPEGQSDLDGNVRDEREDEQVGCITPPAILPSERQRKGDREEQGRLASRSRETEQCTGEDGSPSVAAEGKQSERGEPVRERLRKVPRHGDQQPGIQAD